jgi:hypothetical protein
MGLQCCSNVLLLRTLKAHVLLFNTADEGQPQAASQPQPDSQEHVLPQQHWPAVGCTQAQLQSFSQVVQAQLQLLSIVFSRVMVVGTGRARSPG